MGSPKQGRGRPRREYHIRVRAERRATPDYRKLARALLEHAAMEEARRQSDTTSQTSDPKPASTDAPDDKEADS